MSQYICLEEVSFLKKTCRACSRYDPNDSMTFHPIFKSSDGDADDDGGGDGEPSAELARVFKEFVIWNLEIKPNDGLPQQMCNDCLDRFVQVKLFREEVLDSQQLLNSHLKGGAGAENGGATTITIQTLPMSDGGDRVGYVSPSKLIEYVGSEEEYEENASVSKNAHDIGFFEENESDYLFNHPNQMEERNVLKFKADSTEPNKAGCNKKFEEKSADVAAIKAEEPEAVKSTTKCDVCMKNFQSPQHLMRHVREFHLRRNFTCPICGDSLENTTRRVFHHHVKTHRGKKYKCVYCEKSFIQKIHLINHERVHTKEKPFVCNVCGKRFRQQISLQDHSMKHDDPHPFKCDICGKGFTHRSGIAKHLRLHAIEKQYQCEVCGEGFLQKTGLELHMQKHSGEKPYKCEFCAKCFRQSHQLGNHMHSVHLSSLDSSVGNGEYQCSQCDREFTSVIDLIRHKRSHDTNNLKFLCQQCGAGFKRQANLNSHIEAVHVKKKPYDCIYCSKSFAKIAYLNEHLKVHSGSKPHKCSFCDKAFTLRKTLLMHEAIHTREKRFKCNFCDESFVYRQTLGAHVMNHFLDENEEEYTIKEEILSDDDFLNYDDDLDLQDEFEQLDSYNLLMDEN